MLENALVKQFGSLAWKSWLSIRWASSSWIFDVFFVSQDAFSFVTGPV